MHFTEHTSNILSICKFNFGTHLRKSQKNYTSIQLYLPLFYQMEPILLTLQPNFLHMPITEHNVNTIKKTSKQSMTNTTIDKTRNSIRCNLCLTSYYYVIHDP